MCRGMLVCDYSDMADGVLRNMNVKLGAHILRVWGYLLLLVLGFGVGIASRIMSTPVKYRSIGVWWFYRGESKIV